MSATTEYLSTTTVARHKHDAAGILYRIDVFANGEPVAEFRSVEGLREWWQAVTDR